MIRFYNNKAPVPGEIVVVKITAFDDQTLVINASLLEYGGLNGMICRAEVSRNSAKQYKRLTVGKIIPVLCSNVSEKTDGSIYVDLNYVTFDKDQFNHYVERYNRFMRIIDSYTWIVASHLNKTTDIEHNKLLEDSSVYNLVKSIVELTMHTLTKDEIDELFFKQTSRLHKNYVSNWKNHIPIEVEDFANKMLIRFPLPNIKIEVDIQFSSFGCNGVKQLQHFCNNFETFLKEKNNNTVSVTFANMTSPHYRFIIMSPEKHIFSQIKVEVEVEVEEMVRNYLLMISSENSQISTSMISCKLIA